MPATPEADLSLARLLHGRGFVPEPALRACLEEAQQARARGEPEASLAAVLLRRGLVSEELLARARSSSERLVASSGERAPPPSPPRGPWRLVRELARGGMGAVWEAEHQETGERQALKLILERGPLTPVDPEELVRFRREAETLGRLDHPGVVRLLDAALDGPAPWFVQELLPGGSLEQRLREGPLPPAEALELGVALGEALQHAHERGVLHRDLKPANVLFDAEGRPKLVDFGLARAAEEHERLTRTGSLLGTPHYMAPEQAIGLKEDDPRTDVYGLGGVLYAALTGRPPFEGAGNLTVLRAVMNDPPTPPRQHRPEVPLALEGVVLRALAKERDQRFASAGELVAALQELRSAPGAARSPVLALAAVAALSLLLPLGLLAWRKARAAQDPPGPAPVPAPAPVDAPTPTPAPVDSAPPARLPAPTRVWPPPLPEGAQPRRWHLAWSDLRGDASVPNRIELVLEERAAPAQGELELTVQALRVALRVDGLVGSGLHFDSAAVDSQDPFLEPALRPLIGASLRLRVDPRSGEIQECLAGLPDPDLARLQGKVSGEGIATELAHGIAGAAVARYLETASHLLARDPADSGPGRVPVWVAHDWGISALREVRWDGAELELSHRGPWKLLTVGGRSLRGGSDSLGEVIPREGRAAFDGSGLLRSRVEVEYAVTSPAGGESRNVCTFLLERQDP